MRFFHLLVLSFLFVLTACQPAPDPRPAGPDCGYDLPRLDNSDGQCEPDFLDYDNLDQWEDDVDPALPTTCRLDGRITRKFRVETLANGSPTIAVHLYKGTRAATQIQFFGTTECGEEPVRLTKCIPVTMAVQKVYLRDVNQYRQIYGLLSYVENDLRDDDFISLAAYTREPRNERIQYHGIDRNNDLEDIYLNCDGETYQRVVVANCDPNADLDAWIHWIGRQPDEYFRGQGGIIAAFSADEGTSPKKSSKAVRHVVIDANETGTSVTSDKATKRPLPATLRDQDHNEPQDALQCRDFQLGTPSNGSRRDNLVIVNIDSGAEYFGNWDGIWDHHRNYTVDGRYTLPGELGYDFFFADHEPEDNWGHGTMTGGTLAGSYRGKRPLTLLHYKIFGPDGQCTYFGMLVALHVAVENGADIINASWGEVNDEIPEAMECAIAYAQSEGVRVFTSAGNDQHSITFPRVGDSAPQWPASFSGKYDAVTTVTSYEFFGASLATDVVIESTYANYSDKNVSLAAYMTAQVPEYGTAQYYYPTGTSVSSPLAAANFATVVADGGSYGDFRGTWSYSPKLSGLVRKGSYLEVCD